MTDRFTWREQWHRRERLSSLDRWGLFAWVLIVAICVAGLILL